MDILYRIKNKIHHLGTLFTEITKLGSAVAITLLNRTKFLFKEKDSHEG